MSYLVELPRVQDVVCVPKRLRPAPGGGALTVHPCHELTYVLEGTYVAELNQGTWAGGPGHVFYYPPGVAHRGHMPADGTCRQLVLQWEGKAGPGSGLRPIRAQDDGRILGLLLWMQTLTPVTDDSEAIERNLLCTLVLRHLHRLASTESSPRDPVCRAVRLLRRHVGIQGYLLSDLAVELGMTTAYLGQIFRARMGVTPMQYLRRLRVEAAVHAIVHTDLPLDGIARQAGLCNASHLWRLVKRECGCAPSELRDSGRQPPCP